MINNRGLLQNLFSLSNIFFRLGSRSPITYSPPHE